MERIIERFVAKGRILEEDSKKLRPGVLSKAEYPICNIGELNRNDRMYSWEVWDGVAKDDELKEKLEKRALFSQEEHPEEGSQTKTDRISGVVTEIREDRENNKVHAIFEILDTPMGRIIDTLLKADCGIGVSTRAEGELEEIEEGGEKHFNVIPDKYKLVTIDFTADPSTYGAYPEKVEKALVGIVKSGITEEKIDKKYASALLEGMKCTDAKCVLETLKKEIKPDPAKLAKESKDKSKGTKPAKESITKEVIEDTKGTKVTVSKQKTNEDVHRFDFETLLNKMKEIDTLSDDEKVALKESKTSTGFVAATIKLIKGLKEKTAIATAEKETIEENATAKIAKVSENYAKDVTDLSKDIAGFKETVAKLKEDNTVEVDKLKEDHTLEVDKLKEDQDKKVKDLEEKHIEALKTIAEKTLKEVQKIYEKKMDDLKNVFETERQKLIAEKQNEIFQKTVVDVLVRESGLELPESAMATLRKCTTEAEVEARLEDFRYQIKENLLHSGNETIEVTEHIQEDTTNKELLGVTKKLIQTVGRA